MSLTTNDISFSSSSMNNTNIKQDQSDVDKLDLYLAVVENNKKSSRFIPDDALVALDMAGFVRGCLTGGARSSRVSTARLALSLVQPCPKAPIQ